MPSISVVVPVYNPGHHIDDLIASLLRQTMPASEFEVIFVDDGSTDDTPARLDALDREHPHIHVVHQENSGWPGKPRNVGIDRAQGEFILFVDNDDWLGDEALERMYAYAVANGSDILIPRYVGHGRGVARELFRKSIPRTTLEKTPQVIDSMTPHKLVRREWLLQQGIRFPEGRRRLEDHVFFIEAYLKARIISVLSDYPYYHHVNRDDGGNAARSGFDPRGYFGNVREVLDIIDAHTEPGAFRDRLYRRWYTNELMGRVNRGTFLRFTPDFQEQVFAEVHRLSLERFGEHLIDRFGASRRVRAHLIRHGDLDTYRTFLAHDLKVRARATLTAARWTDDHTLSVDLTGRLEHPDGPLFRERDKRVVYALPGDLADRLPESAIDVTAEATEGTVRVLVLGRDSQTEYFLPAKATLSFEPAADGSRLGFGASATVDLRRAAAGAALPGDDWDLKVRISSCSWSAETWVASDGEASPEQAGSKEVDLDAARPATASLTTGPRRARTTVRVRARGTGTGPATEAETGLNAEPGGSGTSDDSGTSNGPDRPSDRKDRTAGIMHAVRRIGRRLRG